jgi:uncharacterized damage-inducible protein DinB
VNSLQSIINSSGAFAKPINIIQTIPFDKVTLRPENVSHSLYEELWHIDYWLRFSLALIGGENPVMPAHSADSFPSDNDSLSEADWQTLVTGVLEGLDKLAALSQDETELVRQFNAEKTVQDEVIIIAAHNAYHFGRMVLLRQLLGIWSKDLGAVW